jgi:hypothetical protein
MLHKSRIGVMKKRTLTQREPSQHLAQALFRLGEFGAVGFVVLAMIRVSQRPLQLGVPIDVYIYVVLGLASFILGWSLRRMLTGNADLS